jgi:hypothetical protein
LNSFTSSINTTIKNKLDADTVVSRSIQVDHNATTNYVANRHIDHTAVSITTAAGSGLSGGGDITTTRDLSIATGGVTNTMLAGSIANNKLSNSSLTIGTTAISLGGSSTTLGGLTSVISTAFTGSLQGNISGNAATVTTNANLTGVVTSTGNSTTIPNGNITNVMLANSSFHIGTTSISLGRGSASQTLTGVSIDGNATSETLATVTARGASTSTDLTFNGALTMGTSGTQYIRMGRFPASLTNSGEAWIGRASDRSTGTMTVQLGSGSDRNFEIVDHTWSTVVFNAGMNSITYKNNVVWHAGNDGSTSGLDADLLDGNHASAFSPVAGGSSITTVGTISSGVWNGTAIAVANGGTGASTAANARTNLGATTVGGNLFTLTNPSAITFPRINADNTISTLNAADFRSAIGAGTSSTTGTVTSVGGTGTVSGLSLSGTVTSTGNLTLSGTLTVAASNFSSQTANTFLAAPNGSSGTPSFRTIVAADVPTLNQNTTGNAATATEVIRTVSADNEANLLYATIGTNDFFRIRVGGGSNAGFAEIATADDATEPIYVRQYSGTFSTLTRTATLLDGSGNTSFPGTVTAPTFSGALSGNASTVTNGVYTNGSYSDPAWITLLAGSKISGAVATATSADQIDGIGIRNTNTSGVAANTLDSNGLTYVTDVDGSSTNLTGNSTDGALYSQIYSSSWQHQIYGDYRTGIMYARGKNNGTWAGWKRVALSSATTFSNVSSVTFSHTLGTANVTAQVFDTNGDMFWPSNIRITSTQVILTFASNRSGRLVVTG